MSRFQEKYKNEVAPALMQKFAYSSVMQIPKFDKIVINVGCGDARENSKVIDKVIAAAPSEGKVIVAGANIVSKHTKARKQGDNSAIVKTEGAIYASKVQLYCKHCDKGVRSKVVINDGVKVRVCAKCGKEI